MTVVKRASLFTLIRSVLRKTAAAVTDAMTSGLEPYADKVSTITLDNGKEFAGHEKIVKSLETIVYFTHPHASRERGTNENTNGLASTFLKQKT